MRLRTYILGLMLLISGAFEASGQQIAQYSQYLFNHFNINPAVAGSKECIEVKLGYRKQWMGFESAPNTAYVNIQGRLGRKKAFMKDRHGIGAFIESDDTGPTSRTTAFLAYAYHVPVNQTTYLSGGLFAGIQQYRLDASNIYMIDPSDPVLGGSSNTLLIPDIAPGIWMYSDKWYAGLTLRQLLRNKIKDISPETRLSHHYALTGGYKLDRGNGMAFIPSALVKFAPMANPALDLNMIWDYDNRFQLGLGWRNTDAVVGLFRVNFLRYFTFGYSFDFTTSKIRFDSANTHELMLGISACPRFENGHGVCPAYQ